MELDSDPRFSDHPFWILTQINGNPPTKKEICLEILSFDLFFCICSEPDGSDSYSDHMIRIQGWAFVHELLPNTQPLIWILLKITYLNVNIGTGGEGTAGECVSERHPSATDR